MCVLTVLARSYCNGALIRVDGGCSLVSRL